MASRPRVRLLAWVVAISTIAILSLAWHYIRQNVVIGRYGKSAHEAYVVIYRPQPVCYRVAGDGIGELVRIIREETAAGPFPKYASATLAEVVFLEADGSASVTCGLHVLPGSQTDKSIEDRFDSFEQMVSSLPTVTKVTNEVMSDRFGKKALYSFRRQ